MVVTQSVLNYLPLPFGYPPGSRKEDMMIKLIWRRACLLLLASMLMGAMLGAFNSTNTFAQEIFYDGYDDSGGGGATWYCGISSVEVNGKT